MPTTTDIVKGLAINHKNHDWLIAEAQFVNPGKGSAFTRTKLKNLKTGQMIEHTFRSGEAVEVIDVQRIKCQYLYEDGSDYHFMNNDDYEQFSLSRETIGNDTRFLIENTECYALYIEGTPISVQLPPKMVFEVIEAPPGVKGDTANGGSKDVVIETGAKIKVPLFIKQGEKITVNTADGNYVGKA